MDIQKSGAKMPKLLKENPLAAAAISKLNTSKEMKNIDPLSLNLPTIAMSTRDRIKSNEDIPASERISGKYKFKIGHVVLSKTGPWKFETK